MKNKKAMSSIISTVIIIALVIGAVAIIWGVLRGTLGGQTEKITQGIQNIYLNVEKVTLDGDNVSIKIVRQEGEGNMTHVQIFLDDGESVESVKREASLDAGEGTTFKIIQKEMDNVNITKLKKVESKPIIQLENDVVEGDLGGVRNRQDFIIK